MHKQNLFISEEDGYHRYRIPGIVVTRKGSIIVYCEARKESSDWADMDILMRKSTDGGETWGSVIKLVDGVQYCATMNNPVMIAEKDSDTIHFLFCKEYRQTFYCKSTDEGSTWSEPKEITNAFYKSTYSWKVIATGPGHGIELKSGRLLVPVWMANGVNDTDHGPSAMSTLYSDDHGDTWCIGEVVAENNPETPNPNETAAVELADGSVMLNIRNNHSCLRRAVSISADGICNWSALFYDETLVDPKCFGSIVRYSEAGVDDKNRILFVNINNETERANLTLRMSEDEGRSWPYEKLVQEGPAAYPDIAVGKDKSIYVLYENGPYKFLTFARLKLQNNNVFE